MRLYLLRMLGRVPSILSQYEGLFFHEVGPPVCNTRHQKNALPFSTVWLHPSIDLRYSFGGHNFQLTPARCSILCDKLFRWYFHGMRVRSYIKERQNSHTNSPFICSLPNQPTPLIHNCLHPASHLFPSLVLPVPPRLPHPLRTMPIQYLQPFLLFSGPRGLFRGALGRVLAFAFCY